LVHLANLNLIKIKSRYSVALLVEGGKMPVNKKVNHHVNKFQLEHGFVGLPTVKSLLYPVLFYSRYNQNREKRMCELPIYHHATIGRIESFTAS